MSVSSEASKLRVVLYEGHGSRPVAAEERFAIVQTLLERGYPVTTARVGGQVSSAGSDGAALVLGRFMESQPEEAEQRDAGTKVYFRELPHRGVEGVGDLVETVRARAQAGKAGAWKPWFPVIDYSRCTNCLQCLSFCLFDVYGVSTDEKIKVQTPSNCKTDCPACSRVCPEVAILFPKYKAGPINGDEVSQADVEREKMKVDISALLGGDIYAALRERSDRAKTRFAKERDDQRALEERRRCLVKLQQELDIPPEVLAALPTQDQIRERAARALAAAQEGKS
jgi:Pyruvate/2-oxoacid:ferredoxin oxidoreductase delta subunit